MSEPLFMQPVFHEKLWGGDALKRLYHYPIPSNHTGECWGVSGHPHGLTRVRNGKFKGQTLARVWYTHPEIFGNVDTTQRFPILTKILDAHQNLSVQVHPDNAYAKKHDHDLGKDECWYIIAAKPGARLFYGHNARSKSQLVHWIKTGQWKSLLRTIPVHAGDFIYVPFGMVHALGKGIVALETQHSSDATYRFYDFNRIDPTTGKPRRLDIKKSIDMIKVPPVYPELRPLTATVGGGKVTRLVQAAYFNVSKIKIDHGHCNFNLPNRKFTVLSILHGNGQIMVDGARYQIKAGDHLVIPGNTKDWQIFGDHILAIMSTPGPKVLWVKLFICTKRTSSELNQVRSFSFDVYLIKEIYAMIRIT